MCNFLNEYGFRFKGNKEENNNVERVKEVE